MSASATFMAKKTTFYSYGRCLKTTPPTERNIYPFKPGSYITILFPLLPSHNDGNILAGREDGSSPLRGKTNLRISKGS